jgi:hypothetical protein
MLLLRETFCRGVFMILIIKLDVKTHKFFHNIFLKGFFYEINGFLIYFFGINISSKSLYFKMGVFYEKEEEKIFRIGIVLLTLYSLHLNMCYLLHASIFYTYKKVEDC